ncbi:FAD-dependent oxidoreductase [Candidatus Uhrbacteria bacterium]|jgi:NAD(P)H-nitrite reductase large subunit|nr:FAD-dependent oxidoreductase [Candidatus Uhrbacteria bacterium]MBT7717152.1 FAD-dependent oxidoreductase [Candidatus Uhrbacteria bacterium]
MKFVIIGGGVAGTTAAEEIRRQDASAEITIIEQEPHRLYSKILLAKYVTDEIDRDRLFLKSEKWYTDKNIELMSEARVLRIDSKNKFVETSEKREIPYDKLIVATGQQPKMLEVDMRGIAYFRTLDDAEILKSSIAHLRTKPKEQRRIIVVGGAFISMEYIHIAQALDIPISIILRSGGFWSRVISQESQEKLFNKARELGIDIHINETFDILGESEFEGVKLSSGVEIGGSILAVGVGVQTDGQWVIESGFDVERGVTCSKSLEVQEDIYTIGDVCEFEDGIMDRAMHIGNWTNAIMQGRCAATNALGDKCDYEFVSSYATRLGDIEITFIGDTDRSIAQDVRMLEQEGSTIELFDRGGRTVGAVILGLTPERAKITKAIQEKKLYEHNKSIG